MIVWPGKAYPLGATFDGAGTNFSLFSEVAERVELMLYDDAGNETSINLRAYFDRMPDEKMRAYSPEWSDEQLIEWCGARLAGYLNPQLAISLSQDDVYPGQVAWQAGTRTVVCEVRAASGQLDQSVRGAS